VSLEAAIQKNTDAIERLISTLQGAKIGAVNGTAIGSADAARPIEVAAPTKAEVVTAREKAAQGEPITAGEATAALHGHVENKAKPAPKPEPKPEPKPAANDGGKIEYKAVGNAGLALIKAKGAAALAALLREEFGVANARELTEDQYADAIKAMHAAALADAA
jgi:hypothetical protein